MKQSNKLNKPNKFLAQTQRRKLETSDRLMRRYRVTNHKQTPLAKGRVRIVPLGGQSDIGEKNMIVVEYENDALVLDCGFSLGLDLPGVNYAIPAVEYLQSIKHKLRGYVISHGHMDHTGALTHVVPECPAPIYGSQFTIGAIGVLFEKAQETGLQFTPEYHTLNMGTHEQIKLGVFTVELVRVTHSVPESSVIVIDTPVGRIINTGDFRLDPEPLDDLPSDIARLKQLGDEGVLLLMSESTGTNKLGRTPTEHTLQDSFGSLIGRAKGRVFTAVFSSNMNRVQMVVDAAVRHGRKVAIDGRSMMAMAERAVRLGNLKIPKGTLVAMRAAASIPDSELVVICTGGQGEPGAAMSRMAMGEHQYIKLKHADTVIISSTPIPGNERSYQEIADCLASIGVKQYRHGTHEIDGCGPLHVSGHAARDEHAEMIQLTRPDYLMPIYGGALHRQYHRDVGVQQGLATNHIIMIENGGVIEFDAVGKSHKMGSVTAGTRLVDQSGSIVPELVIKDRLLLRNDGFVVVTVTVARRTGRLISSPDIVIRGVLSIRENMPTIDALRLEIRKAMAQQAPTRQTQDQFKLFLKDVIANYVYTATGLSPIIVPVVTTVETNQHSLKVENPASPEASRSRRGRG